MRRIEGVLIAIAASTVVACYTSRPLEGLPAPSSRIVAQLTDSGVVAMAAAIGASAVEVEGIVQSADAERWELRLIRVDYRNRERSTWNQELVVFPRYALTRATERTLNKPKSWLAAGSVVALAVAAAGITGIIGGGNPPDDDPNPPN